MKPVENSEKEVKLLPRFIKPAIEIAFILFLFYSNLLMGEFTRTNAASGKSFLAAGCDVFSKTNFTIGVVTAVAGYTVFNYLRKRYGG